TTVPRRFRPLPVRASSSARCPDSKRRQLHICPPHPSTCRSESTPSVNRRQQNPSFSHAQYRTGSGRPQEVLLLTFEYTESPAHARNESPSRAGIDSAHLDCDRRGETSRPTEATNGSRRTYDAFISYSGTGDAKLGPVLQRGRQQFAKPWYRLRALRIFRDDASLSANPDLWGSMTDALDQSDKYDQGCADEPRGYAEASDGTLVHTTTEAGVEFWDPKRRRSLDGLSDHGIDLALGPDGATLATSSLSGAIRLWDVARRQPLGGALADPTGAAAMSFTGDGTRFVSATHDGGVAAWDPILLSTDFDTWRARLCRVAGRNLTRAEWAQFLPGQPYRPTCPGLP